MATRGPRWLGFLLVAAGLTLLASQAVPAIRVFQDITGPKPRRYHYYYSTGSSGPFALPPHLGITTTPSDRARVIGLLVVAAGGICVGAFIVAGRRSQ